MKKYNKANCNSKVRASITDKFGKTIQLIGTHAFEWSIVLETDGRVKITTYPNGREARKAFNDIRRKNK